MLSFRQGLRCYMLYHTKLFFFIKGLMQTCTFIPSLQIGVLSCVQHESILYFILVEMLFFYTVSIFINIFQVTVTQKSRVKNTIDEFKVGKLFMIDLAGSERAAQTKVLRLSLLMMPMQMHSLLLFLVVWRISCGLDFFENFVLNSNNRNYFDSRIVVRE